MTREARKDENKVTKGKHALTTAEEKVAELELPNIQKVKAKFEKTGTANVVTGKHYGVALKDEGDYISVRFGSIELTEIGNVPTAERNFATKDEAFAFAKQIQNRVRETLSRCDLDTSDCSLPLHRVSKASTEKRSLPPY
ncbi:MAG: hypothetical protein HY562_09170 [Ignavibacteriales bacterium]|nr:hypothetical protein [Ignavibacteriales bacterium]